MKEKGYSSYMKTVESLYRKRKESQQVLSNEAEWKRDCTPFFLLPLSYGTKWIAFFSITEKQTIMDTLYYMKLGYIYTFSHVLFPNVSYCI